MSILSIQRRLREVGRIRLGEKAVAASGKEYPTKLDRFRFTSADEQAINAVAGTYGGTPEPWDGAAVGKQWQLTSDSTVLDVIVPPVDLSWSQHMELWTGGICRHRCDGQTDWLTDAPCSCVPGEEDCKPTSRLGVILTAIDGIGVWRLESHGWAAAQELNGAIEILRVVQNRGAMVPARLLLEQRQQKRINKDTGKPETLNFAVPVLDLQLSVAQLVGGGAVAQLAPAPAQLTASVTPIPRDDTPLPSVAEQIRAVDTPTVPARRANAAAALPATGIRPRPAAAIPAAAESTTGTATVHGSRESAPTTATATPQPTRAESTRAPTTERPERTPGGASQKQIKRLFALMNGSPIVAKDRDTRLKWASVTLGRAVTTFDELSSPDASSLMDVLEGKDPEQGPPPRDEPQYDDGEEPF